MPLPDLLGLSRNGHWRLDQLADQRTLGVGVARLTRLGDPFRARRNIQAALAELAKHFES